MNTYIDLTWAITRVIVKSMSFCRIAIAGRVISRSLKLTNLNRLQIKFYFYVLKPVLTHLDPEAAVEAVTVVQAVDCTSC